MTSFTDEEEDQTEAGRLGMAWLLDTALKNAGAVFDDGPSAWTSHVVVDRNLITGQNPGSSEATADAVINLVGILQGKRGVPYGPQFAKAHVELPNKIVAACQAKVVRRLIHMSAIGADSNGPSMYLRSKGDGEKAVRESNLATTIFRPSVVFGPEDNFLNQFAFLERIFPVIPLACSQAKIQPIFVGDVAKALANVLDLDAASGRVYELAGPTVYTLEELVRFSGAAIGKHARIIRLPDSLGRLQAMSLELAPGEPMMSRDNLDSMKTPAVASGPMAPELGIEPASIEAIAPMYLTGSSTRSRFNTFRASAGR